MKKVFSLLLFVSLLCFSLSACSKDKEYSLELNGAQYIVTFSKYEEAKNKRCESVMTVYEDGSVKELKLCNTMAIETAVRNGDQYFFFSRYHDIHYQIIDSKLELFHLLEENYAGRRYGVFSSGGKDGVTFETVNVGSSEQGYLTRLALSDTQGQRRYYNFYQKVLCNAAKSDDLVYVIYFDLTTKKPNNYALGITKIAALDPSSSEVQAEYTLPDMFLTDPDYNIECIADSVYFFSNRLHNHGEFGGESYLGYCTEGKPDVERITLQNVEIKQIFTYDEQLLVLDAGGTLRFYDSLLNESGQCAIDLHQAKIRSTQLYDGVLHLALFSESNEITILSFDLETKEVIKEVSVPHPEVMEWDARGGFAFLPVLS